MCVGVVREPKESTQVSGEMNSKEKGEAQDIGITGIKLNRTLSGIIEEGKFAGGELKRISGIFRKRVNDHILDLLSPVVGKNSKQINVVRHKGIEEIGHRWSRMHIRRRTGRSQTTREMTMYGALTAVLSNIENKHYSEKVLSKIDFLKEFSSITKEEIDNAGKLIRPNPRVPIIRNDRERKPVLAALVKILEINHNLPGKDLKAWVKSIKI